MPSRHPSIPGSFVTDGTMHEATQASKLDPPVGARSRIFQPPHTPSASASSSLHRSTGSLDGDCFCPTNRGGRKRARADEMNANATPASLGGSPWADTVPSIVGSAEPCSPLPFVNTRYRLAGGLDTPTARLAAPLDHKDFADGDGDGMRLDEDDAQRVLDPGHALARPGNGRGRGMGMGMGDQSATPSQSGWSAALFGVVGGVAARVWQFWQTSASHGFSAGAGPGYDVRPGTTAGESQTWSRVERPHKEDVFQRDSTPVPGQYPCDDDDYTGTDDASDRPAKKIQRSKGEGELRGHWVMVSSSRTPDQSRGPTSRATPRGSGARRTRPSLKHTPARSPARASSSRPVRRPTFPSSRATTVSHAGSPALPTGQAASYASPRSAASASTSTAVATGTASAGSPASRPLQPASPIPNDALRLIAKRRRAEKEADASIQKFNDKLKAMIREGKEALGSTIEIETHLDLDGMDGGF
ncbi:MAG: hypothetical protein M1838_002629 [Thelocarpon superellum]|nr:MAG: hypothetical protein M1838_002629 [Thelocarpon superellum]